MRVENSISMLSYLRQAIGVWKRYPFSLTAPMVIATWLTLPGAELRRFHSGVHFVLELGLFSLACVVSYVAHTFVSRITGDLQEAGAADWRGALALCRKSIVLRTGVGLAWRFLLWFSLALSVTFVFAVMIYVPAAMMHHKLPRGWSRLVVWVVLPLVVACITKYSFAIPYVAFARGEIKAPIALSVTRTKPILRQLVTLIVCGSVPALAIAQIFRAISLHLALTPGKEVAWGMLRDAVGAVPNTWLAIAVSLLAYRDFAAIKDGVGLAAREEGEIKLIDGLPAYQPSGQRSSIGGL